jgi:hypothetical protein
MEEMTAAQKRIETKHDIQHNCTQRHLLLDGTYHRHLAG